MSLLVVTYKNIIGYLHNDVSLIYYCDQSSSGLCFLLQTTAFVVVNLAGITRLFENMKRK